MVVIPVADGVDVCGFECLILEVALKHGINRCTFADAKWASSRQPRGCILGADLSAFVTRDACIKRLSDTVLLEVDFPNVLFLNPDCARNHFTLCGIHADSLEPAILCDWLDENSVVIVLIDIQQPSDACDFLCRKERISVHLLRQCLRGNADGLRDIVAGKACADDFGPQIQIFAFHDNNLL